MYKNTILTYFVFLSFFGTSQVQYSIEGQVLDSKSREPVPFANVYLDRTRIGTGADEKGKFTLTQVAPGKYDLNVSVLGYRPFSRSIRVESKSITNITLYVVPDPVQLDSVTVTAKRIKNRASDFYLFKKLFLGETFNSAKCKILNPNSILVQKNGDELIAEATEPIIVLNEALGYKIHYILKQYVANEATNRLTMQGKWWFETLEPKHAKQAQKWKEERDLAYFGSPEHFLRSLKTKTLKSNYFRVEDDNGNQLTEENLMKNDSILQYRGTLTVIYTNERSAYTQQPITPGYRTTGSPPLPFQRSRVMLSGKPVQIHDNGSFENFQDITFLGYFIFINNISELVPLGYEPSKPLKGK